MIDDTEGAVVADDTEAPEAEQDELLAFEDSAEEAPVEAAETADDSDAEESFYADFKTKEDFIAHYEREQKRAKDLRRYMDSKQIDPERFEAEAKAKGYRQVQAGFEVPEEATGYHAPLKEAMASVGWEVAGDDDTSWNETAEILHEVGVPMAATPALINIAETWMNTQLVESGLVESKESRVAACKEIWGSDWKAEYEGILKWAKNTNMPSKVANALLKSGDGIRWLEQTRADSAMKGVITTEGERTETSDWNELEEEILKLQESTAYNRKSDPGHKAARERVYELIERQQRIRPE